MTQKVHSKPVQKHREQTHKKCTGLTFANWNKVMNASVYYRPPKLTHGTMNASVYCRPPKLTHDTMNASVYCRPTQCTLYSVHSEQ